MAITQLSQLPLQPVDLARFEVHQVFAFDIDIMVVRIDHVRLRGLHPKGDHNRLGFFNAFTVVEHIRVLV